jgi:hypothetical protein
MDGCQAAEQSGKKYHDFPFLKKMSFFVQRLHHASCGKDPGGLTVW